MTIEKTSSPLDSPLDGVRSVSARGSARPHSLRRSRSRNGLMKEYGALQDAALSHIAETRAQAQLPNAGRGPLRRSYAEKMKEMEMSTKDGYREKLVRATPNKRNSYPTGQAFNRSV